AGLVSLASPTAVARVCDARAELPACMGEACRLAVLTQAAHECKTDDACTTCVKRLGWHSATRFGTLKSGGLVARNDGQIAMVFTALETLRKTSKWMPAGVDVRGDRVPLKKVLEGIQVDSRVVEYMWVHRGYWQAARRSYRAALSQAKRDKSQSPRLLIAGYGAGGAVAEIAAWTLLVVDGWRVSSLHTFGAPAVGGEGWSRCADLLNLTRRTHRWRFDEGTEKTASGHAAFSQWLRERPARSAGFQHVGDCKTLGSGKNRGLTRYIERLQELPRSAESCADDLP
ncbi:MAG: hypothetical protein ACI9WU_003860, partial [Myxococcota bacterium]